MKIKPVVIFGTWSGNTKKVAERIAAELTCPSVLIKDISRFDLNGYNLFIIGSPVHASRPLKEVIRFLEALKKPVLFAFFVTYGAPFWGKGSAKKCINFMKRIKNNCIGTFQCRGYHRYFFTYLHHPDTTDLENAGIFAEDLVEKATLKAQELL